MSEITPRWEWRSFGSRFGEAEKRLAALTPSGVQESDEVYLLTGSGGNVKFRAALMDIKELRQVNADGLEQWTPVMKAAFPISAADAASVFEALQLPTPSHASKGYTLDEFVAEVAVPGGAIRAVKVHKRRTRYTVGGCMAELSDVVANGKPTRTIAVESEDAAGVIRAVGELGLGGLQKYQLSPWAGGPDRRRAGALRRDRRWHQFGQVPHRRTRPWTGRGAPSSDRAELTRLGEGLAQRRRHRRRRARENGSSDHGHGRRSETLRRTGDCRRGHRRPSDRFKRETGGGRHPGTHRRSNRGDFGRGGSPAGLRGRQGRSRVEQGLARRLRHGRRQFPVHIRARWPMSTSASASMSVPCGTPSATGSTRPSRPRCCARRWRRFRLTSRASTDARFPTRWSQWAAR